MVVDAGVSSARMAQGVLGAHSARAESPMGSLDHCILRQPVTLPIMVGFAATEVKESAAQAFQLHTSSATRIVHRSLSYSSVEQILNVSDSR